MRRYRGLALAGLAGFGLTVAALPVAELGAGVSAPARDGGDARNPVGLRVPLSIATRAGRTIDFQVEVARSDAEQTRGLMFRTALPGRTGMIFPMNPPRPASFWMRNTLIPLDMIFVRADGSIARIAENTVPQTLDQVESGEPVAAVLEIDGGEARALGIAPGDRVRWQG